MAATEPQLQNATNDVCPRTMKALYARQGYRTHQCTDALWHIDNLTYLIRTIDATLTRQMGENITIAVDHVFYLEVAEHASRMPNHVDIAAVVHRTNEIIMKAVIKSTSLQRNRRKLFLKNYIYQDRDQYLAYPTDTHGRYRSTRASTHTYYASTPDARYSDAFKQHMQVLRSQVPKSPDLFSVFQ
jgi:hypothetical protein